MPKLPRRLDDSSPPDDEESSPEVTPSVANQVAGDVRGSVFQAAEIGEIAMAGRDLHLHYVDTRNRFLYDSTLATTSNDFTAMVWDTDPERAVQRVCAMVGRDLTRSEWAELSPESDYRPVCGG
jgi:hypothetical protein